MIAYRLSCKRILIILIMLTGIFSCDEELRIDEVPPQMAPEVSAFEPAQVQAGETVRVTGKNLKYAATAFVGDKEVAILYKVNDTTLVISISNEVTSGVVKVANQTGEGTASAASLTILYEMPVPDQVPSGGQINEAVVMTGLNLQYVKRLFIGDEQAEIISIIPSEIVFKVPFLLEDQATLSYVYASEQGDQTIHLQENGFGVLKSWPSITYIPSAAMINTDVILIGENMNVVDSAYIGTYKLVITAQDALTLTFKVPNDVNLEGYQSILLYSYGGQELSSGPVMRIVTKLEKMLENFEAFTGNPFEKKKDILPVYLTGLNTNSALSAPEGASYAGLKIDYDQSQLNNSGSTFSEFNYKGENNLIDLTGFEDPWIHMWINTSNTSPYFVFYCDLSVPVGDVTRGTHYVKRFNSADYGEGWQLFAWRLKDLKFRSGTTAAPYSAEIFSIYNLKTFRIQYRTSSDVPKETSEFNFDSFMVVDGKMKDAHDVTQVGN